MYIEKNSFVKITCKDKSILDGKIENICLLNDKNILDAGIFLIQQENSNVPYFGSALIPISFIESIIILWLNRSINIPHTQVVS